MLWIILFAGIFLFFFPVIFRITGYLSVRELQAAFGIKLFGWIPVQKGILQRDGNGLLYRSPKHEKEVKENHFPKKAIKTLAFRQVLTVSSSFDLFFPVLITTMERIALSVYSSVNKKHTIKSNVLIKEGETNLTTSFQYVGYISIYTFLLAWLKQRSEQHG